MGNGLPKCIVKVGGNNVTEKFPVTYVETFNGINRIPYCVVKLQEVPNSDKPLMNDASFKIGAKVEVEFGYDDNTTNVFSGTLIRQSVNMDASIGMFLFEITAKDDSFKMTIANKVESYKEKVDADIIKAIISQAGLSANVGSMSVKHDLLTQYNVTDWDFINMRAEAYGFIVSIKDSKVNVNAPQSGSCSKKTFGEDIISINLDVAGDMQLDSANGRIWDVKSQKVKDVKGNPIPEKSFGSMKYSDITKVNGKGESNFVHSGLSDETELKTLLDGVVSLNRLSKIQGVITVFGDNAITPDSCIAIEKCGEQFNGNAYVNAVQHIFDEGVWTTKVYIGLSDKRYVNTHTDVFTPGVNGVLPEVRGLIFGTVIKIDGDPENNFRVQVYIPTIHNPGEGVWCRLSTFYASQNGGAVFFPEVNDEVIVGFIENDPRYAVVLGSVYNPKNKPSVGDIKAENDTKKICTNSKMEVSFNEKDKIITITTPGKRTVTISDKDESLELINGNDGISITKGAINIKCSKDVTIEGKNINLKANSGIQLKSNSDMKIEGGNVSLKGSSGMKIEGGTSASLKSSGITEIKGRLVNIN